MDESMTRYIHELDTPSAAYDAAREEADATGGRPYPATMFMQGGRINLSLAMTMADISRHVVRDSAVPRSDPRSTANRPLMPDHARTIENYLVNNADGYILPSITLTVAGDLSIYTMRSPSPLRSAWLVLRNDTQFLVTDGQHRLVALTGSAESKPRLDGALRRRQDLAGDGVAIHLVFEKDPDRIHQDFADAAQTKQIPPSMLAAYNTREPFNRVLLQIVEGSDLLGDRVDMSSKTLGKKSQRVFLLNQVRGFLKEIVLGDYAATEDTVARVATEQLATKAQQDAWVKRATELLAALSGQMEPWTEVVKLRSGTPEANRIPALRERYLNMTATGLNIIGRIGHLVFTNAADNPQLGADYFRKLASLQWLKEDSFWSGNVIIPDTTRVLTAKGSVDQAFKKVRQHIGIPRDWQPLSRRKPSPEA